MGISRSSLINLNSTLHSSRKFSDLTWPGKTITTAVVFLGLAARFFISTRGHNYDFEAWKVVAEGLEKGLSPWQAGPYVYGPGWAFLLYTFRQVDSLIGLNFRTQIIAILSLADLMIAYYIWKQRSLFLALIILLNPISIIITGYHNQFDNLAIAIFLAGLLLSPERKSGPLEWRETLLLVMLSLSLSMKHVFLVFVFWLAVRQKDFKRKFLYFVIPPTLFALSFAPFRSSWSRITDNANGWSADNGPLWTVLGLEGGIGPISLLVLSVLVLSTVGLFVRKWSLSLSVSFYLVLLVITTPNSAGQYFAIAAIGAIGLGSLWFVPYFVIATYVLMVDYHGLHFISSSPLVGIIVLDTPVLTEVIVRFALIPLSLLAGCIAIARRVRKINVEALEM